MELIGEQIERLKPTQSIRGARRLPSARNPRGSRTHPAAWAVLLAAVWLGGCAAPPKAPTTRPAGAVVPAIAGERLLPLSDTSNGVAVLEGPGAGQTLTQRMQRHEDHWTLTLEGRQRMHIRQDEGGDLLVFKDVDFEQNVVVQYEPALLLLPATVDGGFTEHQQTSQVTVRDLNTGDMRDRGTVTYRIPDVTHVAGQDPTGPRHFYTVTQHRELDLDLADATVTIETTYVPGTGRVAWMVDRYTRALGLISGRRVERYRVAGFEGAAASTVPAEAE